VAKEEEELELSEFDYQKSEIKNQKRKKQYENLNKMKSQHDLQEGHGNG
jgi:hypothetical protein